MSGKKRGTNGKGCVACREEVVFYGLVLGLGVALLLAFAPGVVEPWVRLGLLAPLVAWVVVLWLGSLCLGCRRGWAWSRHPALWLMALLFWGEMTAWAAHAVLVALGVALPALMVFLLHTGLLTAVVGGMGWVAIEGYTRLLASRDEAAQAKLAALQARVRPHFLFNALNTAAALVHARPALAEGVLEDLAALFRAALEQPHLVALADELALVRRYLVIEALRLEARLRVRWVMDEPIPPVQVPALAIQPLVENAVRHGIEGLAKGGEVVIAVHKTQTQVVVAVRNPVPDGGCRPHPPVPLAAAGFEKGYGVGLAGVRARLLALLGPEACLETQCARGMFEARIVVPFHSQSKQVG